MMRPDQWLVVIFVCLLLYSCVKGTDVYYEIRHKDDSLNQFSQSTDKEPNNDVKILRIVITNEKE